MPRRLPIIFLFLVLTLTAQGQVRGILGFPDRVMSSSRIGKASSREVPEVPEADTSRMSFPAPGDKPVPIDYDFFNYLIENDLKEDAKTLVLGRYAPSDTLDFMRAKVLFSDLKLYQASEFFDKVPSDSPFGAESFYYKIVSLTSAGEYEEAARFAEGGPYAELTALQGAGLALLRGKEDEFKTRDLIL